MIRAVLFDYWNTLFILGVEPGVYRFRRAEALARALRKLGFKVEPMRVLEVCTEVRAECSEIRRKTLRECPAETEVEMVCERLGVDAPLDYGLLVEAYMEPFLNYLRPRPGVREALSLIRRAGLKMGIVSNSLSGAYSRRLLRRYGLEGFFDCMVFSNEVGYVKPHPEIFRRALAKLNVGAGEAVMVGDEVETDIRGAKALGMTTILIGGEGEEADFKVDSILEAARIVLELSGASHGET